MTAAAGAAFDRIASGYDDLWTRTATGRLQREAVWRFTDRLFAAGDRILDLGCGTGEDAVHLLSRGIRLSAIDASSAMVEAARGRRECRATDHEPRADSIDWTWHIRWRPFEFPAYSIASGTSVRITGLRWRA